MGKLEEGLERAIEVAEHPRMMMEHYMYKGKKIIGCLPMYTPEVIAHAAGFVPIGLWGGQVEQKEVKAYLPAFACPIMQSCMELGLRGTYEGISAVLIPCLCDVYRCIAQNWDAAIDIPMIAITYPQNRQSEASIPYLMGEFEEIKGKLEKLAGHKITDEALNDSIDLYNRHATKMREFAWLANDHLDVITPEVRHVIFKSALFMEKGEHILLMDQIIDGLRERPKFEWKGKRVILTGITAEPNAFLAALSSNNVAVVGDDLGQETQMYRTDIPDAPTPLERLARQWQNREATSLAYSPKKARGDLLVEMVGEAKADGVIVCLMKFCDPEEYDFPIFHARLKEAGIPTLSLDVDQQPNNYEQAKTRVQAFAEML